MANKTTPPGGEINRKAAEAFWAVQRRIDSSTTPGVQVGRDGARSFSAQYASLRDPPITRSAYYYQKAKDHASGVIGNDTSLPASPQVVIPFGADDVAAMEQKDKMALQMDFDSWIMDHYKPWDNPMWTEWLQKKYPAFFQARVEEMKNLHELQKQWQEIQIMGVQSIEDLYLLWRVSSDDGLKKRLESGRVSMDYPTADGNGTYIRSFNPGRWSRHKKAEARVPESGSYKLAVGRMPGGFGLSHPAAAAQ